MSPTNYLLLAGLCFLLFVLLVGLVVRRSHREARDPDDGRPVPKRAVARSPAPPQAPVVERPAFQPWRLVERLLANPHSAGGPLYRLCFAGEYGVLPEWRPGAVAQVYCGPALDHRTGTAPIGDYMIGSIPTDGLLDLVVRRMDGDDPARGRRSHFLCDELQPGDLVAIALRDDPAFAPPPVDVPMILIGNATGIAGLHAHIRARPAGTRNWLIYGDRNSSGDRALAAELIDWLAVGHLERCDLVFPGEGEQKRLVVDHVEEAQSAVLDWMLAGCAIYVCGSNAMGDDIDAALLRMLGDETLKAMTDAGLYRRSTY